MLNKKGSATMKVVYLVLFAIAIVSGYFIFKNNGENGSKAIRANSVITEANAGEKQHKVINEMITSCDQAGDFVNECKAFCMTAGKEKKERECAGDFWSAVLNPNDQATCVGAYPDKQMEQKRCAIDIVGYFGGQEALALLKKIDKKIGEPRKPGDTLFKLGYRIEDKVDLIDKKIGKPSRKGDTLFNKLDRMDPKTRGAAEKMANELGLVPKPGKKSPGTSSGTVATQTQGKSCAAIINAIASSGADPCTKTYRYVHEATLACFQGDLDARSRISAHNNKCEAENDKGLKKYSNIAHRSAREIIGWNGIQRAWGTDLNNGWEPATGGDIVGLVFNGVKLYNTLDWASNNLLTAKQQDKWLGRDPVTGYPITGGGGPQDPDGPIDGDDVCANCVGPGNPGDTSYAGTVGDSGIDINTHIDAMTPVEGIGGAGIYGNASVIHKGAGYSANNTLPSNLTAEGHSGGMTKLGLSSSEGLY